jgi:asparagine synthase (glutamine-hydrolysing)
MCGIAGIIDWSNKAVAQTAVKTMTDAIKHRGPDGEGFFTSENIGLGHRRLSIIDLSDAGNQPMYLDDLVLIFNGEIYNYIEVRAELQQLGYTFSTASDSEVLLRAYQHWGSDCLTKFNGMWAFVIFNKTTKIVFCSRDRFGVKPFYYTIHQEQFIFCSEIKGILALTHTAKPNWQMLTDFLVMNMTDHTHQTHFDGIFKLPAGHTLTCNTTENKLSINPYYNIAFHASINALNETTTVATFKEDMERSIKWRLRSDVKVGTCLSGGLDSSYIAKLASDMHHQQSAEPFKAITALSVDPAVDESAYAKQVVQQCQLDWVTTKPDKNDFLATIDEVVYTQEEPFGSASISMQYFVMKAAKEAGIVVLLDGQGADEVMLGYSQYIVPYIRHLPWHKKLKALVDATNNYGIGLKYFIQNYIYFGSLKIRYYRQLKRWSGLKQHFVDLIDMTALKASNEATRKSMRDFQYGEIKTITLPALLRYEDKNSMHFSIETRLPFLDWQLVEHMTSVNNLYKIKDGWSKNILRKAMNKQLPDAIVWRKKKFGFNSPDSKWLNDWSLFEAEVMNSKLLQQMFNGAIPYQQVDEKGKWRLVCMAKWEKVFHVTS